MSEGQLDVVHVSSGAEVPASRFLGPSAKEGSCAVDTPILIHNKQQLGLTGRVTTHLHFFLATDSLSFQPVSSSSPFVCRTDSLPSPSPLLVLALSSVCTSAGPFVAECGAVGGLSGPLLPRPGA